jgi:hypothetical protein
MDVASYHMSVYDDNAGKRTYSSFGPFKCGLSFLECTLQLSDPVLGAIRLSLVIPNLSSKRLDQFNLDLLGIANLLNLLFPALGFTV